ncbi:MAG: iron-sulfur cluster assembly scaffold protein [Clostridia bacterium]|nr:iron-sulfur cluster assembly scaffold protein [Clostridia bacterium]
MYNEKVMKEFISPSNVGEVKNANAVGEVGNASCGDIMKISMRIENGIIEEVKFQTYGCAAAVATSSIATKMIKGKTIDEALAITNQEVVEELGGLPAQKIHCSVLAEGAIKAAIKNYLENYKMGNNA